MLSSSAAESRFWAIIVLLCVFLVTPNNSSAEDSISIFENNTAAESVYSQSSSEKKMPLSVTVRGGVSLGAYEAGYLYYLTELLKLNPGIADLKVVTGASAGTINALLVVESLRHQHSIPNPTESLFYKTWTNNCLAARHILDVATNPDEVQPGALSSGKSLKAIVETVRKEWIKREPEPGGEHHKLDIILGATATRFSPHKIEKQPHFSIYRQEEKFSFRVRQVLGNMHMTNYLYGRPGYQQALLPTDSAGRIFFDEAAKLLLASSAFPLAFPPQELSLCMRESSKNASTVCVPSEHDFESNTPFVDGGVFDNNPLRLAYKIIESDIKTNTWKNTAEIENFSHHPDDFVFLYLDPDNTSYPHLHEYETDCAQAENYCAIEKKVCSNLMRLCLGKNTNCLEAKHACKSTKHTCDTKKNICKAEKKDLNREKKRGLKYNLFAEAGGFLGSFMGTSMTKELNVLDEEDPIVLTAERLAVTTRDYPTASGHLANFFGFFDTKLLKYDFFLGMHDADSFVRNLLTDRKSRFYKIPLTFPEEAFRSDDSALQWQPFRCMRAVFDGVGDFLEHCSPGFSKQSHSYSNTTSDIGECGPIEPVAMQDFLILIQSSLDQLYNHCRYISPAVSTYNKHCNNAQQGKSPPFLLNLKPWDIKAETHENKWRQIYGESDFLYMLGLLEAYKFEFTDLGL